MGIIDFLFRRKPIKVYTHLDEDRLKDNELIRALQQQNMAKDSQLSKIFAKEKEKKDKIKEKDKESEINKKLLEQKADLDANKHGKVIKLHKFYYDLLVKEKWKKKPLEIVDKNDEVVLANFGDFGIMTGGKLCIMDDKGELMAYGKNLSHVLYKPDAFENMVRRGRFTIPMDKDGNWMEDMEYKELPEPLDAEYDQETGKVVRIVWSKIKTSEVKKIIADKMEQIHYLSEELERSDNVIIKLTKLIKK